MRRSDAKGQELRLGPERVGLAGACVGELWRSHTGCGGGLLVLTATRGPATTSTVQPRGGRPSHGIADGAANPWPPYVVRHEAMRPRVLGKKARGTAALRSAGCSCRVATSPVAMTLRSDSGEVIRVGRSTDDCDEDRPEPRCRGAHRIPIHRRQ